MAERLGALPGERASFEPHAGENHMSILPVTVNRAAQAAFALREENNTFAERLLRHLAPSFS